MFKTNRILHNIRRDHAHRKRPWLQGWVLKLFSFSVEGVDYEANVDTVIGFKPVTV